MSNYTGIDWTGAAINQKNRASILDFAMSPEGQAYQKEYDTQAKVGEAIAKNEDLLNPSAFNYNPTSRYEAARTGNWRTTATPDVQDVIDYMMRSGVTTKDLLEGARQHNDNIYKTTGQYSLDPNGMLSRTYKYDKKEIPKKKWYDFSGSGLLSGLTLGASDLFKGNMPGTDWASQGTIAEILNPVSMNLSHASLGLTDLAYGIDKAQKSDGDFWEKLGVTVDRALDPFGVDPATRATGDLVRKINPEEFDRLVPYAGAIGSTIGTLIYPGAGTAAGYGIATKLAQGNRNYDYLNDLLNAAVAYAGGAAGGQVGGLVKGATGSAVLGGAAGGATSGAITNVPTAVKQNTWDPIWQGALAGGAAGGIGTGARIGAYGLGASKAIANLVGQTSGKLASAGTKALWLNRNS